MQQDNAMGSRGAKRMIHGISFRVYGSEKTDISVLCYAYGIGRRVGLTVIAAEKEVRRGVCCV